MARIEALAIHGNRHRENSDGWCVPTPGNYGLSAHGAGAAPKLALCYSGLFSRRPKRSARAGNSAGLGTDR
jgi:hypothetical protein